MGCLSFDDIAIYFSEEEWKSLKEGQKALYKDVMIENYQTLRLLGIKPSHSNLTYLPPLKSTDPLKQTEHEAWLGAWPGWD
uniref:KRAB domain-containing protein n=1 Tax=Xenopus tropicalis TaxID=8364 RepID=A0A6I8SEA0_XENTR